MRPLRPVEEQWLFDPTTLAHTPSADDGIPLEEELRRRRTAIENMRSLALRANVWVNAQDTEATHLRGAMTVGATLIHRFYMRRSLKDFPEKLIAPTVLFLATKIEEEPLKLRYIVNVSILKFEGADKPGWDPERNPNEQPSREYRSWEKDILALEEVVLEAVCFDMGLEVPWVILRSATKGLDELEMPSANVGEGSRAGQANGSQGVNGSSNGKGKGRITESIITQLGWTILSESSLAPLSILFPAQIIAFTSLALLSAVVFQISPSAGLAAASELGGRFGLDINYEGGGAKGEDLDKALDCLTRFMGYIKDGLILDDLVRYIPEFDAEVKVEGERFERRFSLPADVRAKSTGAGGRVPSLDPASAQTGPGVEPALDRPQAREGPVAGGAELVREKGEDELMS